MRYEFYPLTDFEKQKLTVARIQLNECARKRLDIRQSVEWIDEVQELMMRDWLFKKYPNHQKNHRINPRTPGPRYDPYLTQYDTKLAK